MAKISKEKFKVFEGVFDNRTINALEGLKARRYFDEFSKIIQLGKEASVYYAKRDDKDLAVKIYRVTASTFKNISKYIVRDFRFKNIKGNTRKVIMAWTQKEYRNLMLCHKANMNVPYPYKRYENIIIMDFINGMILKDTLLDNPEEFFELLLEQLKLMKNQAKLIHGDLSEYNILVEDQLPIIIDLGQGMSFKNQSEFNELYSYYLRDMKNIVNFFNKKYNMNLNLDEILKKIDE